MFGRLAEAPNLIRGSDGLFGELDLIKKVCL
jgi:hypothetical protein